MNRHWDSLRTALVPLKRPIRLAFHAPCSLQHGMKVRGVTERILADMGYTLVPVQDSHLCCGSAGTYSIFNPDVSTALRDRKLAALAASEPDQVVSANIGCMTHLQAGGRMPVRHWITLLDERLRQTNDENGETEAR